MDLYRFESFNNKFSDKNIENLLKNNWIYLNSREQFNDPFDFLPKLIGKLKKHDLSKNLNPIYKLNRQERRKAVADKNPEEIFFRHYNKMINSFGIKSFSSDINNILLWSHYSNGHNGFCVKFIPIDSELKNAISVNYSDFRPEIKKADFIYRKPGFSKELPKALLTKAKYWGYEKEFRIIKNNAANKYEMINPEEVDSIYFGIKTENANVEKIRDINKNKNIKFFKCEIDENSYSLKIKSI